MTFKKQKAIQQAKEMVGLTWKKPLEKGSRSSDVLINMICYVILTQTIKFKINGWILF